MIPSDKFDEEAIQKLKEASGQEIIEKANELLVWLQDCNWPVFPGGYRKNVKFRLRTTK